MKKIILSFFIFSLAINSVLAQTNSVDKEQVNNEKYRLNLPDFWKPGSKVWQILDEKLPLVAEELKDKQLCGDDCKPKYSIEFEMSEPEILDYHSNHILTGRNTDSWEFVTLYSFSASLYLFDDKDKVLTKFILVDTNEVWRVKNRAELPSFAPRPPMRIYALRPPFDNIRPNSSDAARMHEVYGNAGQGVSPFTYINNNKEKLSPTQRDLFTVVDQKIRSWQ